jgi:hypothetical protein
VSVGIWTFAFEGKEISAVREVAAEIEELGSAKHDFIRGLRPKQRLTPRKIVLSVAA